MKEWIITAENSKPILPVEEVRNLDVIVYSIAIGVPCFIWIVFIF
jgi:hypothetical protein